MPSFGRRSKEKLAECDERLQRIANAAIKITDFSVYEGHRGRDRQNRLFRQGASKLQYPRSKHNAKPSNAMDIAPYPIDWQDSARFYFLAGVIKAVAAQLGIGIRWGGDWDSDGQFTDQTFHDLPHFELVD